MSSKIGYCSVTLYLQFSVEFGRHCLEVNDVFSHRDYSITLLIQAPTQVSIILVRCPCFRGLYCMQNCSWGREKKRCPFDWLIDWLID